VKEDSYGTLLASSVNVDAKFTDLLSKRPCTSFTQMDACFCIWNLSAAASKRGDATERSGHGFDVALDAFDADF